MRILIAESGLCWGIRLAYERINDAAADAELAVTHRWGPRPSSVVWDPIRRIVEDDDVELHQRYPNLRNVKLAENPDEAGRDTRLAVGHHGVDRAQLAAAQTRGVAVLDFRCPFIENSDRVADRLASEGYDIIAFGKPGNHHCEYAREAAERAGRVGLIAEDVEDIRDELCKPGRQWSCMGQVTANASRWSEFRDALAAGDVPVKIVDTVCSDSHRRQDEAVALAREADVVLVVNDNGGASVSVLERCLEANERSFLVDPKGDIPDLSGATSVAIVGGIHVPGWIMASYAERLRERYGALTAGAAAAGRSAGSRR